MSSHRSAATKLVVCEGILYYKKKPVYIAYVYIYTYCTVIISRVIHSYIKLTARDMKDPSVSQITEHARFS